VYDTILVSTDGSASATRAVTHALELGELSGAELHAVYVVDTTRFAEPALSSSEIATNDVEAWGQQELDEVADRANALGLDAVVRCCHGKPHVEIVEYADQIDADVIVLGYQGHTHADSDQLGSVTDRVVDSAGRPVLIA